MSLDWMAESQARAMEAKEVLDAHRQPIFIPS